MNLSTKKWIFLKISSIIIIPLMLWFIINFISIYDKNYIEHCYKYEELVKILLRTDHAFQHQTIQTRRGNPSSRFTFTGTRDTSTRFNHKILEIKQTNTHV